MIELFPAKCRDEIFPRGGILYFLKHYNHTARCVKTVRMSVPRHRINKLGTNAHHRDRSAAAAIFANGTYFLDNRRNSAQPLPQNLRSRAGKFACKLGNLTGMFFALQNER